MNNRVKRRTFLASICAAIVAPRLVAQEKLRRVAFFSAGRAGVPSPFLEAIVSGLRDLGWIEGQNIAITPYWSAGSAEDEERMARGISETNPEVIVGLGRNVIALQRARPSAPVVFGFSGNPVDAGFAESLARPGGNSTGISLMSLELAGKRIELLKEMVPRIGHLAILARPQHPGEHRERAASEEAARKVGLKTFYAPIGGAAEIDDALRAIDKARCDSLVAFPDASMHALAGRVGAFALERRLATASAIDLYADSGFLFSYGPNLRQTYRALARYIDRILRGTKPGDLAIELPSTLEFVVNGRTARTLGIAIPPLIMHRVDRVIA